MSEITFGMGLVFSTALIPAILGIIAEIYETVTNRRQGGAK